MAETEKKQKRNQKRKRVVWYFAVLFAVTLATLFLWRPILGVVLERLIIQQLQSKMDAEALIGEIQIKVFPPSLTVKGFQAKTDVSPVQYLEIKKLKIVPGIGPAFLGKLVIERADVSGVRVALRISGSKTTTPDPSLPESLQLPLRDLIQVELGRVNIDRINVSVEWPEQDLRVKMDQGALSFEGQPGQERLAWKGSAKVVRKTQQLEVPQTEFEVKRSEKGIQLSRLLLKGESATISANGKLFPELNLDWAGETKLADLEEVLQHLQFVKKDLGLSGSLSSKGTVRGPWDEWSAEGTIRGSDLILAKERLGTLQGSFEATPSVLKRANLTFEEAKTRLALQYEQSNRKSASNFKFEGTIPYRRIENLYQEPSDDTHLVGLLSVSASGSRKPNGDIQAEYQVTTPEMRLVLEEQIRPFLPLQFTGIKTNGNVSWSSSKPVVIENGQIDAEGFSGEYSFEFGEGANIGKWKVELTDVGNVFAPEYQIKGKGSVGGGIDIGDENHEILLAIELPELGLRNYEPASFRGDIVFLEEGTLLREFRLENRQTQVKLDAGFEVGEQAETFLKTDFSNLSLGWASKVAATKYPVVERIEGRASGYLNLEGRGEDLTGRLEVGSSGISIKGESFDRAEVDLEFLSEGLKLREARAWRDNASLSAKGVIGEKGFEDLVVSLEMVPLGFFSVPENLRPWMTHVDGQVRLVGEEGNPKITGEGRLFRETEEIEYSSVGKVTLDGVMQNLGFRVDLLGRKFIVEGNVNAEDGSDFQSEGFFQEFPLTPYMSDSDTFLSGQFELHGDASTFEGLEGLLRIERLVARSAEWRMDSAGPSTLRLERGRLSLAPLRMKGPETQFQIQLDMDSEGLLNGGLEGTAELRILQLVSKDFRRAEGVADFKARIGGTSQAPELFGQIGVRNGQVLYDDFPHPLENLFLDLSLEGRRIEVNQGVGRLASGDLRLNGNIFLPSAEEETQLRLTAEVEKVQLRFPTWMPSTTSGSLQILGPFSKPLLQGQFTVHRAVYRVDWDWKSKILNFGGTGRMDRLFRAEEENFRINLSFVSEGESIEISNNLAEGRLRGSVRMVGSDQRFGLLGRLELVSGTVEFLDNEFELESGSISFEREDAVDPVFDLNAQTRVEDILIFLDIRSEGEEVVAFLSSDPVRDETSIIALLTLGVDVDDLTEGNAGGSSLSGSILPSVLSGPVQSQLESGLKKAKLIDTLQFVPFYSEDTNTSGLRLIVGKRLFPKVQLLYSTDLFDVGAENTLRVEQRFNENVSLQGNVRDNRDEAEEDYDLGVDFEFRLDF